MDEFNKIIRRRELAVEVLSLLTEVRHRKTTIVFACQLPEEYPTLAGNVLTGLIVGRIEGERSYNALAAKEL